MMLMQDSRRRLHDSVERSTKISKDPSVEAADQRWAAPVVPRRIGRFHVLEPIGAGGMGVVYAAYDDELDRKVAIKLLHAALAADLVGDLDAHPRLIREAQALAQLSHPNVVQVYEIGRHEGQVVVAMEYVRGTTLQAWLRDFAGPRPWQQVLEVFIAAGRGLAAAHHVGLVHRDFKPSNVMLGDDGRVRVVDFGLVSSLAEGRDAPRPPHEAALCLLALTTPLTLTGDVLGTPAYMAPEQYNGRRCDPRADQFSFCVALFEALYGVHPYPGATVWDALEASERGEIRRPPPGSRVPSWLYAALVRGLSPDPAMRWPSMAALLHEIGRDRSAPDRTHRGITLGGLGSLGMALGLMAALSSTGPAPIQHCEVGTAELACSPTTTTAAEVVSEVVTLSNANDTEGLFARFSPELKRAVPLADVQTVLATIAEKFGELKEVTPIDVKQRLGTFLVSAQHGALKLTIALDNDGVISSLLFSEADAKPPPVATSAAAGLPFSGEWLVLWAGSRSEHHNGPSQRHAADLVIVDAAGRTHRNIGNDLTDYYAYGKDILAMADGVVAIVVDGVPDSVPGDFNLAFAPGNLVAVRHDGEVYSTYAHLLPGSIKVKVGERVVRGQLLGACGNSGNSSEPHLHVQLQDGPRWDKSWGIEPIFAEVVVDRDGVSARRSDYTFQEGDKVSPPP